MKPYVVSEVPNNKISGNKEPVFYCHMRNFPDIPVFGSIGDKKKANAVCRMMNANAGK